MPHGIPPRSEIAPDGIAGGGLLGVFQMAHRDDSGRMEREETGRQCRALSYPAAIRAGRHIAELKFIYNRQEYIGIYGNKLFIGRAISLGRYQYEIRNRG